MSDEQLIFVIIGGIIFLAIAIKLWRVILGCCVVGALVIGFLCLQGKIDCPFDIGGPHPGPTPPHYTGLQTSHKDIVYAVYQHLKGKTYTDYVTTNRNVPVPCTQIDYETDWAKGDPHLGKCRGTGGYGYGYKTENRRETKQVTKRCPNPPSLNSPVWHVQQAGRDRWSVSNTQGRWTVEKVGGGFKIIPHQKC